MIERVHIANHVKDGEATHARDAHLIGGQGTGLIRTNDIGAAQSFDARKVSDDGVFLSHLFRSKSETCGNDSGQSLRDGGDSEGDSNFEVIYRAFEGTVMGRIPKVPEVDEPYEDADDRDNLREHVSEIIQFTLQRSLFADLGRDGLVNVTDGGVLTCEDDDRSCAPIDDGCALVIMDVNASAVD